MRIARLALAGLAWLFVGLVVLQVFWAGMALFAGGGFALHRDFGYSVSVVPLLLLLAAALARAGRRTILMVVALFVVTMIQTILPVLRADIPIVAALHPVNALLVFWLGLTIAKRATLIARSRTPLQAEAPEAPATQA